MSHISVKSIILCKILYNVLPVTHWLNLIYFLVELSHSSWRSIRTAPINRLADARLGKIRIIFSLLRTSWFSRSRRLVLFSRLWPFPMTVYWKASSKPLSNVSHAFVYLDWSIYSPTKAFLAVRASSISVNLKIAFTASPKRFWILFWDWTEDVS